MEVNPFLCSCVRLTIDTLGECMRCHRLGVQQPGAKLEGSCLFCARPGTEPLVINEVPIVLCAEHYVNVRWDFA